MSKCNVCGMELSANCRLITDFNYGNGSQFNEGWSMCQNCGKKVKEFIKTISK